MYINNNLDNDMHIENNIWIHNNKKKYNKSFAIINKNIIKVALYNFFYYLNLRLIILLLYLLNLIFLIEFDISFFILLFYLVNLIFIIIAYIYLI